MHSIGKGHLSRNTNQRETRILGNSARHYEGSTPCLQDSIQANAPLVPQEHHASGSEGGSMAIMCTFHWNLWIRRVIPLFSKTMVTMMRQVARDHSFLTHTSHLAFLTEHHDVPPQLFLILTDSEGTKSQTRQRTFLLKGFLWWCWVITCPVGDNFSSGRA